MSLIPNRAVRELTNIRLEVSDGSATISDGDFSDGIFLMTCKVITGPIVFQVAFEAVLASQYGGTTQVYLRNFKI